MGCGTRIFYLLGGACFCQMGLKIYNEGGFWVNRLLDNSEIYIGYEGMQKHMGIFSFLIGVALILASVWIKNNPTIEYICCECERIEYLPFFQEKQYVGGTHFFLHNV